MRKNMYAVIMAGGRGERFWPMSTSKRPKQVLSLVGGKPLIVQAVERLEGLIPPERVIVVTSADLVDATCEAAPSLSRENVIGEPVGRDTAAAVALGAALVEARCKDAAFCVLTADHVIRDEAVFQTTIREGLELALARDALITIGIAPTAPSTGFGYIDARTALETEGATTFLKAERFVEKPDVATAEQYLQAGHYYWNSGMFMWSVKAVAAAFERHHPPVHAMMQAMIPVVGSDAFAGRLAEEYGKLDKISVDYALMEKADNILMAKGTFRWDDVGAWPSVATHFEADAQGNVIVGSCEAVDAGGNLVVSEGRLTALIGVEDLVVVQTEGVTLVCPKERAQDVKQMVRRLMDKGGYEAVL